MDGDGKTGWVKLFHPRGVQVTLPVAAERQDYGALLANVGAMLDAGWLVAAPGLEAGEHKVEIGYVVRRTKDNDDRTVTPIVDLYPADESMKFSLLSVYLNRPEDVAAFEHAAGVRLDAIPVYIGDNKIERGKKRETDRLVTKVPRPLGVVWAANPKHNEAEADAARLANKMYTVPKRKFIRWADQKPAATQQPVTDTAPAPAPEQKPANSTASNNPPPATGAELHSRLKSFDGKHAGELWPTGHLLAHVVAAGVKAGYGADIAKWQGPAVKFGMDTAIDYYTAATRAQAAPAR